MNSNILSERHHQRSRAQSADLPRGSEPNRAAAAVGKFVVVRAHGGRQQQSLHGQLLAPARQDFKERSLLGAIAGTGFADWPISYAELEPYYTKVDWDIGVSGLAGASPSDPPRCKPYPMPPLPVKSSGALLERGARKLGLHPFPAPMAIDRRSYRGRPGLRSLRILHRLRLRGDGEVLDPVHHDPGSGSHRPLRNTAGQLRFSQSRRMRADAPPASFISTRTSRSIAKSESGGVVGEWRRDCRACCSIRRTLAFRRVWPTPAAWSASI